MGTDQDTNEQTLENLDFIKFDPSTQWPLTHAWYKLIKSDAINALINKTDEASSEEIW